MPNARQQLYQEVQRLASARGTQPQVEFEYDLSNDGYTAKAIVLGNRFSSAQTFPNKKLAKEALSVTILEHLNSNLHRAKSQPPSYASPMPLSHKSFQPTESNDNLLGRLQTWLHINVTVLLGRRPFTTLLGELAEILHLNSPHYEDHHNPSHGYTCRLLIGHLTIDTSTTFPTIHDARNMCAKLAIEMLINEKCGQVPKIQPSVASSPTNSTQTQFSSAEKTSFALLHEIVQRFHWTNPNINVMEVKSAQGPIRFMCEMSLHGAGTPVFHSGLCPSKSDAKHKASASVIRYLESQGFCNIVHPHKSM